MTRFSQKAVVGLLSFLLAAVTGTPAWGVVGGTNVPTIPGSTPPAQNAYPFMAELHTSTDQSNANNLCGATLIGARFAITAAHCVEGLSTSNLYLTVGGYDVATGEQTGQTVAVTSIISNPDFDGGTLQNDIAVLVLQNNIHNVEPPIYITQTELPSGTTATILGWGANFDGGPNVDILEQAQLPTVDRTTCAAELSGAGFPVTAANICAGLPAGGIDACQGDTGGPLFIVGPSGKPVQIGIISWGVSCGLPNTPGVYTNLAQMLGFVLDTLGGQSLVHLADYAANGDQLKVAQVLDQIGPAAAAGSTTRQDYGRLFMNGVVGTSQSLESLLPSTAFEMNAMVKDFDEMRGEEIMSRTRALREGGSRIDLSGLQMAGAMSPSTIDPTTGLTADNNPAPNPYEAAQPYGGNPASDAGDIAGGAMYNPALYKDENLSNVTSGNPPEREVSAEYTYQGPAAAQPFDETAATPSGNPSPDGFFGWLGNVFVPGASDRAKLNYNSTTDQQLIAASQRYPGQPLGAYAAAASSGEVPAPAEPAPSTAVTTDNYPSYSTAASIPGGAATAAAAQDQNYNLTSANTAQPKLISDRRWGVFVSGDVRTAAEQLMRYTDRTQSTIGGFTGGLDYRLDPQTFLGLAFSYAHGSFSTDGIGSVESDGYALSLYGTHVYAKRAWFDGYLTAAYHSFDSGRTLLIGNGQTRDATVSPTAVQIGTNLETGYDFGNQATRYGPLAGFHISAANFDGYTESGGQTFDLSIRDRYDLSAIGSLGGQFLHQFVLTEGGTITPLVQATLDHEFGFGYPEVQASFVNIPNSNFTIDGQERSKNWLSFGPSIMATLAGHWQLEADYRHDFFRSDIDQQIFNFGAEYRW